MERRESPHVDILLDVEDLEEPLINPRGSQESKGGGGGSEIRPQPVEQSVPWPALRRTSVSVRNVSPQQGFMDPSEVRAHIFPLHLSNFPQVF